MFLELSAAPTGAEVSVKPEKCSRTYEPHARLHAFVSINGTAPKSPGAPWLTVHQRRDLLRQVLSKEIDPIRRAVAEKT
jgi:hypothetical protein